MVNKLKNNLYSIKQNLTSVFYYPKLRHLDESYNRYWDDRKLTQFSLNSFQKKRAELSLEHISIGDSIMDIGCGNGSVLAYMDKFKSFKKKLGIDISDDALELAKKNGVEPLKINILDREELESLPRTDYVCFFEVLEHMPNPESLLAWATSHANKGVFFSVPNTGFFTHRLRLFLGRFPLQWRIHPGEHLRFWTVKDMFWWLEQLKINNFNLEVYEGVPILNKIWPSLFGQGLWIYAQIINHRNFTHFNFPKDQVVD